jgi:hypothetical protein
MHIVLESMFYSIFGGKFETNSKISYVTSFTLIHICLSYLCTRPDIKYKMISRTIIVNDEFRVK